MTNQEKIMLANAMIPIEVVCAQIEEKPYSEMTVELQQKLLLSRDNIRKMLFNGNDNSSEDK